MLSCDNYSTKSFVESIIEAISGYFSNISKADEFASFKASCHSLVPAVHASIRSTIELKFSKVF